MTGRTLHISHVIETAYMCNFLLSALRCCFHLGVTCSLLSTTLTGADPGIFDGGIHTLLSMLKLFYG